MMANCLDRELTDLELNELYDALTRWQASQEFVSRVEALAALVSSSTLFNKAKVGFLRDAIPIAEFAKHREVQSIRLTRQQEGLNDGQFRSAEEIVDIEVTEVMEPGRRRGDEYRCGAKQQSIRDFDPHLGKAIAFELAKGVRRKGEKAYSTRPLLLVYLNITTGGRLGNEVEAAVEKLRTEYANTFREICVLWGTKWH